MKEYTAELVLDAKAELGEGAIWYRGVLYWVDIMAGRVNVYDPAAGDNRVIDIGQPVGTVVPRGGGGLAVAVQHGFGVLDLETETLTLLHDPEADKPGHRFNDGKCDPAGRFWAGTMNLDGDQPVGVLYSIDEAHAVRKHVEHVICSNGIVWTADARTMYYIDTFTYGVDAFDYDLAGGNVSNRRTAFRIDQDLGAPDGMTIDADDNLWIAMWGGSTVLHWDPRRGELLGKVDLPATQVTSCALGGGNLDELYITTAAIDLSEEARRAQPLAGGLFRTRVEARGVPAFAYVG